MPFASGQYLTPARLNALQPKTYSADATGLLAVLAAGSDVPGCSITLTTLTASAIYIVDASFDVSQLVTTNNDMSGILSVDGVDQAKKVPVGGQVFGDRMTAGQTWRGTLAAAGSHTLKLRASATADSQYQVNATNTSLVVMILEVA